MNLNQQNTTTNSEFLGKVPPQAIEIEEVILGAMMLEKDGLLLGITEIQNKEVFYKEAHQEIFAAIKSLFDQSNPVDIRTVVQELRKSGNIEKSGGALYVTELTDKVSSAANMHYHIKIIKEKWISRKVIEVSSNNLKLAYEDTTDVFELLDKTSMEFLKLNQQLTTKKADTGKAIYKASIDKLAHAMQTPGVTGITTDIPELDKITGGWQTPDLVIIAARPGMGKTAFVVSTTKHIFTDLKKPVLWFSLEMTAVQLMDRLIASESEISAAKLKKGHIDQAEYDLVLSKTQHLYSDLLMIDDTPGISIGQLRAKAIAIKLKYPDLAIIAVDYLQLMHGSKNKNNSREQEVSEISSGLKALAKELGLPVLALSQLSRSVESRGGTKKPQLSDLRESGSIEQDADVVVFLYRPEYYGITEYEGGISTEGRADIIYGKNRHGPCAEVTIGFNAPLMKFHSIETIEIKQRQEKPNLFSVPNNFDPEFNDNNEPF